MDLPFIVVLFLKKSFKRYWMKNFIYLFFLTISYISFGQSKIDKSKKELNDNSSSHSQDTHINNSNHLHQHNNDEENNIWLNIAFGLFKYGLIGDYNNEDHLYSNLTDYPFYNKESGNYENYKACDADSLKKDFRIDMDNHLLYSSNVLYGNHLKVKIRPFHFFYIQTEFHQLYEKNKLTNETDRLSLFFFNLGYDRLRFENINLGWTIGATYVGNEVKKGGISIGVNSELFFNNNISLSAAAKWSAINSKPINVYDFQGRYHLKKCFISLGFEHLKIASQNYNFISLGGGIYLN
jgi:hypothetical protein